MATGTTIKRAGKSGHYAIVHIMLQYKNKTGRASELFFLLVTVKNIFDETNPPPPPPQKKCLYQLLMVRF